MTTGTIALLVLVVLILDLPLFFWWRERQRDRDRDRLLPAQERAADLVERALDAYRSAPAGDVPVDRQDLWVRALMAASGESEADAKAQVARTTLRVEPVATLALLLAQAAETQERSLAFESSPELLTQNIAEARQTVMRLVPREM